MDFWAMYLMLIFSGTSSTYIRKFQYQRADVVLKIHTSTKHIHYAYWWGQTVGTLREIINKYIGHL